MSPVVLCRNGHLKHSGAWSLTFPAAAGLPALPFPGPWKAFHDPEEALMWVKQASKR